MNYCRGITLGDKTHERSAIIPYILYNGQLFFLLGIDNATKDVTDFGGGIKKGEHELMTARREFLEETDDIFNFPFSDLNILNMQHVMYMKKMCCIFTRVDEKWRWICSSFEEKMKMYPILQQEKMEVSGLKWFSEKEFSILIFARQSKMWTRLKRFYREGYTPHFSNLLKNQEYVCF